jgi:AraC family transcriptional regulator
MGNQSVGKLEVLMDALDYIEAHLKEEIRTEQVADYCYCSKSGLEKLFRNVNHLSVHDYVIRRRMSLAARELLADPGARVIDLAVAYGYGSHEAFVRAFRQVWGVTPSEYRRERRGFELFPRLTVPPEEERIMGKKHVDITELYDLFRQRRDCWFVCCDIQNLIPINEISHRAGDIAILESLRRMNDAAGDEDVVFRIGGDEFALLTASPERAYAEEVLRRIQARNGECIRWEDRSIPLSLYGGIVRWDQRNLRYNDLFNGLQQVIDGSKG